MITIGRLPDNSIHVDNLAVSGHHAKVYWEQDKYIVEDNNSLNGTYLNNRRISKSALKDQDAILVGKHTVTFVDEWKEGGAQPSSAPAMEKTGPVLPKMEATVVLDAKPRAFQRFMNSITEREQTYVQSQDDPSHALQEISGVGIDADWTPARHELIAAGGDRFTIVTITQQAPTAPAELTAAQQLARAALRDAATQPPTRSGPQPP